MNATRIFQVRAKRSWRGTAAMLSAGLACVALSACSGSDDSRGTEATAEPSTTSLVKRVEITRRELLAGGMQFGSVGAYEKLVGTATLELDLSDPRNASITDKDRVSQAKPGKIEYTTDIYIIRPVDASKGNGKLLFEVNNRGNKRIWTYLNDSPSSTVALNEPTTAKDAGNGFLMRQGYTMAWAGWEGDVRPVENRLTIRIPTATENGQEIRGRVSVQFDMVQGVSKEFSNPQFEPYETASLETPSATLTVRDSIDGPETSIAGSQWSFATCERGSEVGAVSKVTPSARHVCLFAGFDPNKLYQLTYTAKNPRPMAMGYAVTRDIVSFLRRDSEGSAEAANPLKGSVKNVICMGISSSGMYVRDWMYLGFNEDTAGRKVCDGMMVHIPGAHRLHLASRFSQPDFYSRQDLWAGMYPASTFPFTYGVSDDPITGRRDGILKRPATDPFVIHSDTGMEYWQFHASLVTHDANGRPVTIPDNVRVYMMASAQHLAVPEAVPTRGSCEQLSNPITTGVFLRALLTSMDQWVTSGVAPPPSDYPRSDNGTLVPADQASTGFPSIPGVRYSGKFNRLNLQDYGPQFTSEGGVITNVTPVVVPGKEYRLLVPKVDIDGNDVAGLRRPDDLSAPLGTYTGWNHRREGFRPADLCGLTGSYIPFAATKTVREASGDPRLSVQERYQTKAQYLNQLTQATTDLASRRLLLEEDVQRIQQAATQRSVP